jgi:23S rRNA pseudouridine2604 synthase
VLPQGLNRQIRRRCEACGVKVTHLRRIRVMNIMLGGMRPGEYRVVEGEEKRKLLSMLQ